MATGVTAESDLSKINKGHLECPICSNRFREPSMLDCFHTFCLQCLKELRRHQEPSSTRLTYCPLCRRETILEGTDIAGLPGNLTLSALVKEVSMQERLEGQGTEFKCQSCDDKSNPAISKCMDCNHFICYECKRAHERMALMKSHKIYTLEQLQSGEIYKSQLRQYVPRCDRHPDQNLNVYCNTCDQVICTTCSVLDHGNLKHSLTELPDASEKCKRQYEELVAKVTQKKAELTNVMNEIEKSRQKLDSMFAETKRKTSHKADKEIAKIREEEQKVIQEAERIYKDRVKSFEVAHAFNSQEVSQAENMLDEVHRLITQAGCYEILNFKKKLLHNLDELTAKRPERVPDRFSFMDFDEEGEGLLGRLTVDQLEAQVKESQSPVKFSSEGRELKTEFQVNSQGYVASLSNNKIAVARRRQVIAFSLPKSKPKSPSVPNKLPIGGLIEPRCIAVNKDDQLIILDKHAVKIFNKKHQLFREFIPCKRLKNEPRCLAVDDRNLIAVGYDNGKISLHKPDGSLIRTLNAQGLGHHLTTISKQRLIYTDCKQGRLLCIDYRGARVFSADIRSYFKDRGDSYSGPTGVCCDSDGSIYVAVYESPSSNILHYSPDGKFIGCAIRGCGLPRGITLTPAGDLVMATRDSVVVYHCMTSNVTK